MGRNISLNLSIFFVELRRRVGHTTLIDTFHDSRPEYERTERHSLAATIPGKSLNWSKGERCSGFGFLIALLLAFDLKKTFRAVIGVLLFLAMGRRILGYREISSAG